MATGRFWVTSKLKYMVIQLKTKSHKRKTNILMSPYVSVDKIEFVGSKKTGGYYAKNR